MVHTMRYKTCLLLYGVCLHTRHVCPSTLYSIGCVPQYKKTSPAMVTTDNYGVRWTKGKEEKKEKLSVVSISLPKHAVRRFNWRRLCLAHCDYIFSTISLYLMKLYVMCSRVLQYRHIQRNPPERF